MHVRKNTRSGKISENSDNAFNLCVLYIFLDIESASILMSRSEIYCSGGPACDVTATMFVYSTL